MSPLSVSAPQLVILLLLPPALFINVSAQTPAGTADPSTAASQPVTAAEKLAAAEMAIPAADESAYVLGPGDQLSVRIFGADDIPDRPIEVSSDGTIMLPMVGRVKASDVSVRDLETVLTNRYRTYFKDPQISVTVTDYRSQAVTVIGAVNSPGVIQLRGPTRLMRVISQAGGLKPEAGDQVLITHRLPSSDTAPIPSSPSSTEPNSSFRLQRISTLGIIDGTDPAANMIVGAGDLISVPREKMVYVMGDVGKPGGYVLDGHSSKLTVLQAIALAGGVNKSAAYGGTRILRSTGGASTSRVETPIDLKKILTNKSPDIPLHADDILFVPNSLAKAVSVRAIETAVSVGTGILIWK